MSHASTRFAAAVDSVPDLEGRHRAGLQALDAVDRRRVDVRTPRSLAGSVNIDDALKRKYPNDNRWDYVVASATSARALRLLWIEVHPANGNTAGEVAAKAEWLRSWLMRHGTPLQRSAREGQDFRWIATDRVAFRRGSRQAQLLAKAGVHVPVRRLEI